MKQFFFRYRVALLPVSLLVLSLLFSSLSFQSVSAASDYDANYRKVDDVVIRNDGAPGFYSECTPVTHTMDWQSIMTSALSDNSYNSDNTEAPNYLASWNAARDGNGRWAVTQSVRNNGGQPYSQIIVTWTEDSSLALDWTSSPGNVVTTGTNVHRVAIRTKVAAVFSGSDCNPYAVLSAPSSISNAESHESSDGGSYKNLFVFSDHLNLPDGYAGTHPPSGVDTKPEVRPDFDYSVSNLDVTATDHNKKLPTYTPAAGYYFKGYSVEWVLMKCNHTWDDKTKSCSDPTVDNYQTLPQEKSYKATASEHDDYLLSAEYVATECYRYPSYPATPDNCYLLTLHTQFPDYDFKATTVHLVIDGSSFSGSTVNQKCDVSGFCQIPDDGLGMFRALDGIETYGLQAFLTAPIDFYATLPTYAQTCSPITVPIIGNTYTFQLECMKHRYQEWSPTIFLIWQTVLTATVGWIIAFNIFRTIKNINTPDKDGIEVAHL